MNLRLSEQPKLWIVVASGAICSQALLSLLWPHSFRLTAFGDLLQCVLLLFCLLSDLPNIAQAQGRTRLFWLLIGVGFGTWLGAQVLWTYFEIFLHREVPNPFVGDVVLFLHIVPMMAALALQPHLRQDDPLAKLGFLDFALLLTWWLYLFLYVVIPWQYVYPSEAVYGRSFDLLYLSEHLVFLSALLLVWRRSTGQWRITYAYLLGAAALYAISSIAASVAIDFHLYYTGSLYDVPLVASVALFSGIGPIARAFSQRNQPSTMGVAKASIWAAHLAMAAVFSTPFMIFWALFCGTVPHMVRTYRILLTVGTMLVMGGLVFLKQHFLDRELIRLLRVSHENLDQVSRLRDDLVTKEQALTSLSRELQRKNLELQEVSFTDSLTGLWNRRYLEEVLASDAGQIIRERGRVRQDTPTNVDPRSITFLMVDIDSFKNVNDSYGHVVGDELLRKVAKRLAAVVRKSDLLVRWGGEEFLIMTRSADQLGISVFCERILDAMASERFELSNNISVNKTCSIGWASYPWCEADIDAICPEDVIELADMALYRAKVQGRHQSVGFLPSNLATSSPERIDHFNLRDEHSGLIRVVRTLGEKRTVVYPACLSDREHLPQK